MFLGDKQGCVSHVGFSFIKTKKIILECVETNEYIYCFDADH